MKSIQTPTMLLPAILLAVLLLAAQAQDANIVVLTETVIRFFVINPLLILKSNRKTQKSNLYIRSSKRSHFSDACPHPRISLNMSAPMT
jgi:hypothetical protein